ncbi:MAG: YeeE/YedE family protein [Pseudomonadota bacterium]
MLLEQLDTNLDPRVLHVLAGLFLGLVFGAAAQASRFCLRRAVAGDPDERGSAAIVWLTALFVAVVGFALVSSAGFIDLSGHRLLSADVPVAAIVFGGLFFGVGMVLTRGCASRLTVLSATGNLRAVFVLMVLAITAHAAMKGVLAPVRVAAGSVTVSMPTGSIFTSPVGVAIVLSLIVALIVFLSWRARPRAFELALGAVIGCVAVGGWALTSTLLFDEFEPLPVQTASFILPWSETLFWTIASTAVPAGLGVGFIAGVLIGSFASAAARGELQFQSFETPKQTLHYLLGGVLMGAGGVLAGGCTIGAGLSGVATGSIAALLALGSIIIGCWGASTTFRKAKLSPAPA